MLRHRSTAEIDLTELHAAPIEGNRRAAEEVWGVGSDDKAAGAIRHWSEGGAMTPAMVQPHTANDVIIVGGNHRLTAAVA